LQLNYTIESTNRATLSGYPVFLFEGVNATAPYFCVHTETIKRKYLFDYVCEKVDFEQWDIEKLNKSELEHRKGA
jgi:hypothetical protein